MQIVLSNIAFQEYTVPVHITVAKTAWGWINLIHTSKVLSCSVQPDNRQKRGPIRLSYPKLVISSLCPTSPSLIRVHPISLSFPLHLLSLLLHSSQQGIYLGGQWWFCYQSINWWWHLIRHELMGHTHTCRHTHKHTEGHHLAAALILHLNKKKYKSY